MLNGLHFSLFNGINNCVIENSLILSESMQTFVDWLKQLEGRVYFGEIKLILYNLLMNSKA